MTSARGPRSQPGDTACDRAEARDPDVELAELRERLPQVSPATLAAWLGVSTATIRRHMKQGRLHENEVLGIRRIPAPTAVKAVQDLVVRRLPARYRKATASMSTSKEND